MQQVLWNPELSIAVQDNALRSAVQAIVDISNALVPFSMNCQVSSLETTDQSSYLMHRANFRYRIYQRLESKDVCIAEDWVYQLRDRPLSSQQRLNVFETASILRNSPPRIGGIADLPKILCQ